MIDLDAIRQANEVRKDFKANASRKPWWTKPQHHGPTEVWHKDEDGDDMIILDYCRDEADVYFTVHARNDNAEEVIDQLVAEVVRLRRILGEVPNE